MVSKNSKNSKNSKKKNPAGNEPELSPAFGSEITDGPGEDTEMSVLGSIALQ
ncbi:hypothetical protein ACFWD7_51580 [Streptomyces mirabilis]|uniref:hypothetical protein n=1 Tax=Streptomyces mirabilis TaxID=68239 RepID=UPI003676CEA5